MVFLPFLSVGIWALIAHAAAQTQNLCPPGWMISPVSDTCVRLHSDKRSWSDARKACHAEGADLVKVKDTSMNQFIWGLIITSKSVEPYWIGMHDRKREGEFEWLDESSEVERIYASWAPGQPNNRKSSRHSNGQDCVEIGNPLFGASEWNDEYCSQGSKFICEKPRASVVSGTCNPGWTASPISGTCMKLHSDKKSWDDARKTCQAEGGDLVKIEEENTDQFVWGLILSDYTSEPYWIGLRRQKRNFKWLDESQEVMYKNWAYGQPNYFGSAQDCTEIGNPTLEASKWNDEDCRQASKFICEKPFEGQGTSCPRGWKRNPTSNTCIKLSKDKKSWSDARTACLTDGGDLVKIKDINTNQFIFAMISLSYAHLPFWIGMHDSNREGVFEWVHENEKPIYTNWAKGQPNNDGLERGQDCVQIGNPLLVESQWNDEDCSETIQFICEKPPLKASAAKTCPAGWKRNPSTGTCLKLANDKKSWTDARKACQAEGSDLVKIENTGMDYFIWGLISSSAQVEPYWIGLHDRNQEDEFQWLDEKEEGTYVNWAAGQPNNMRSRGHSNGQDCVEIGNPLMSVSKWNDEDCRLAIKFICEKIL